MRGELIQEREDLETRVTSFLKSQKPELIFSAFDLINGIGDESSENLKAFHFLFEKGGEFLVYLWNALWDWVEPDATVAIEGLSEKEREFIEEIAEQKRRVQEQYGERYRRGFNCNGPIETERLFLRPCNEEFDREYHAFLKDNPNVFEEYYRIPFEEDRLYGTCQAFKPLSFAVVEKQSGALIGLVALCLLRSEVVYNLEYLIFPSHRQRRFASEAVSGLLDAVKSHQLLLPKETLREGIFVTQPANIKCVEAIVRIGNRPSASLVREMGFKLNGIQPYHGPIFHDEYSDAEIYDLLIS